MPTPTVVVAMSGGVDSSLAAALLKEQGYEVIGIHMRLSSYDQTDNLVSSGGQGLLNKQCCSIDAANDARAVCAKLDIPFYVLNFEQQFQHSVIDYFTTEYALGRTPNPCIACNRDLKFKFLMQKTMAIGADYLATGHYARVVKEGKGQLTLRQGLDSRKDQSYALYMLDQTTLRHTLLPIGDYRKSEVRELATSYGLITAQKPESMDICFIPTGNYQDFLRKQAVVSLPGPILNLQGDQLGLHQGLAYYTVGQRHGIGLGGQANSLYVIKFDLEHNALLVGPAAALLISGAILGQTSYTSNVPTQPFNALVRTRYHATALPALITPGDEGQTTVTFDQPTNRISAGQAVVFYDQDIVLGGGTLVTSSNLAIFN